MNFVQPVEPSQSGSLLPPENGNQVRSIADRVANCKNRIVEYFFPKTKFTHLFLKIPAGQRKFFLSRIFPYVSEAELQPILKGLEDSNQDTLGKNLEPLLTKEIYSFRSIQMVDAISKLAPDEREDVVTNAARYCLWFYHLVDEQEIVIECMASIPRHQRGLIADLNQCFSFACRRAYYRDFAVNEAALVDPRNAISLLSDDEKKQFFRNAAKIIVKITSSSCHRELFTQDIYLIPSEDREECLKYLLELGLGEMFAYPRSLLNTIYLIPREDRAEVFAKSLTIINSGVIHRVEIQGVIKNIHKINPNERDEALQGVLHPRNNDRIGAQIVLATFVHPKADRDEIIELAHAWITLMRGSLTYWAICQLVDRVSNAPKETRWAAFRFAAECLPPEFVEDLFEIIDRIGRVPPNEIDEVLGYARRLFTPDMRLKDQTEMIRLVSEVLPAKRAAWVEGRLRGMH